MATAIDEAAQAALRTLDEECDRVVEALRTCGNLVNEGRLAAEDVMLRMHQLAAKLMGPS